MAKVYTYVMVMVGMSLLLALAGLPTGSHQVLDKMGVFNSTAQEFTPDEISSGLGATGVISSAFGLDDVTSGLSLYDALLLILGLGVLGTVTIGVLTKGSPIPFLIIGFVLLLLVFILDMTALIGYSIQNYPSYIGIIMGLILTPLIAGYILSIVDYWRGTD